MEEKKVPPSPSGIFVGTAGWDYPDWRGIFYPKPMPRGLHPLTFLASHFDTVEVNASFYRPLRPDYTDRWVRYVEKSPGFCFTVKLWRRFTHERDRRPEQKEGELFKAGIAPLVESGRLGGLLVQFPWSFRNTPENMAWLDRVLNTFAEYPLALEVRHESWNQPAVYDLLRSRRVAVCNIDQPLFSRSIAPGEKVTARMGYVRLHGQNYADWFRKDAGRDARYNYLYSEGELEPWVEKIKRMRAITERLYVITNNHFKSKAAVNAFQLKHRLTGEKTAIPPTLVHAYPRLEPIMDGGQPGAGRQGRLPGF